MLGVGEDGWNMEGRGGLWGSWGMEDLEGFKFTRVVDFGGYGRE